MSAGLGARVAVVESRYLGGTCVNVGCVPKKLFVYGAHVRDDLEDAAGYGWDIPMDGVSFDWPTLVANKNAERSEEHTSELQSRPHLVCRLLLEKKKNILVLVALDT